jgi:hypothetical protein
VAALTVSQHTTYGTCVAQRSTASRTLISQKASVPTVVSQKPDGSAGRTLVQGH